MSNPNGYKQDTTQGFTAEVLTFRSDHDITWDRLGAADAAAVREALLTASMLRDLNRAAEAEDYLAQMAINQLLAA